MTGDNDGALADLHAAIADEPENAHAYFMRGVVYETLAEADRQKAGELNPAFGDGGRGRRSGGSGRGLSDCIR